MINANELRIDNKVYWNNKNFPNYVLSITSIEFTGVRAGITTWYSYEDISPIELTSDILIKAGFEFDKWHAPAYKHKDWPYYITENNDGWLIWDNGFEATHLSLVKYLHTLQNIFYFLSGGTELNITL